MELVAYWQQDLNPAFIKIEARSSEWNWTLSTENKISAPNTCNAGSITLFRRVGSTIGYTSFLGGGSCCVQVTRAAPAVGDVLEGTFSGTLVVFGDSTMTATITNGRFRVPRVADRPATPF